MLARLWADACALVDAVEEGRERHDGCEDSAIVRGVGDGLPLPPIPFPLLLLTVGCRLLLLVVLLTTGVFLSYQPLFLLAQLWLSHD